MLDRPDLHEYQRHAIAFAREKKRCLLALDLGLGKTASVLTLLSDLQDELEVRRVLVVAPLKVAMTTWPNEIRAWEHVKHLSFSVLCGNAKEREAAMREKTFIHTINVENLAWLERMLGQFNPYDMVVFDESSMYKNRDTKRFKVARRMCRHLPRTILLSATPAPNGYMDLWAQIYLIDGGKRLGEGITHYRHTYFTQDYNGQWRLRKGAAEIIQSKIADIMMSMDAKDYLSVPERVHITETVLLGPSLDGYREFERKQVQSLPEGDIEATSAGALMTKLMQYANGQVYDADKKVVPVHDAKLEALREIVREAGEPLLICYTFLSDRARLLAELPNAIAIDKNPATIDKWNRGEIPILLIHPLSAGHGLNLQHGGRRIIWYGPTWSLEGYMQANGRLHRQGQTKPVLVQHLVAKDTIDETIMHALSGKNLTQSALLAAMKHRVAAIREELEQA